MNIRRVIRANRLLAEQGHANDTLAALGEMAALRKDAERYRALRAQLANDADRAAFDYAADACMQPPAVGAA